MKSLRIFLVHEKTEEAIIQLLTTYEHVKAHASLSQQFTLWSKGIILDTSGYALANSTRLEELFKNLNLIYFHRRGAILDKIWAVEEVVRSAIAQDQELTHVELSTDQDIYLTGRDTTTTADIAGFTGYNWRRTDKSNLIMLSAIEETGNIDKTDIETICSGLHYSLPPHNPNLFWGCKSTSFAKIQYGMLAEIARICRELIHESYITKILEIFNAMLCTFATTGSSSDGGISLRLDDCKASLHADTDGRPKLPSFVQCKDILKHNNILDKCIGVVSNSQMQLLKGLVIDSSFYALSNQIFLFDTLIKSYRGMLSYELFKNRYILCIASKDIGEEKHNSRFVRLNNISVPMLDREFLKSNQANIAPWNLKTLQLWQVKDLLAEIPVKYWQVTPFGLRATVRK